MTRSRYPGINGKTMIAVLKRDYEVFVVSQKGSHIKVKRGNYRSIVPDHREIVYGTFSAILEQLHIDEEEFINCL